ncbi:MAG: hypothetical protein ABIO85_08925 [Sphingomicrobium sp.]
MTRLFLFFGLLFGATGYALWRGDRDSRLAAIICLAAVALTQLMLQPVAHRYASVEGGVVAVDAATLIGFTLIALRSSRFWPLWIAGLQLTTMIGHALKAIDWALVPRAYGAALIFWSYPILLIVMGGAWRVHRRRLAGVDAPLA